jgi:NAD(P)-dependent dehydrogenase (short-subunit alcohol dehydrogenase family)
MMVGLMAPTLLSHALIPLMPPKSKIINISGTFEDGGKGWIPYFVSKRAVEDLTIGLSDELKEKDIQVNCISPSDTATEVYKKYFPQFAKDANTPEIIATEVVKLCSSDADNLTGKIFVIKHGEPITEKFHT